jgi:hypothetical protein
MDAASGAVELHRWAARSLNAHADSESDYGIFIYGNKSLYNI